MLKQGQDKLNSTPIWKEEGRKPHSHHVSPHILLGKYFEVPKRWREWGLVLEEAPGRTQSAVYLCGRHLEIGPNRFLSLFPTHRKDGS